MSIEEKQLEDLRRENWDDVGPRVMNVALLFASRFGWNANSSLPKGMTVEDLVFEAIKDLFADPSRRRPDVTLVTQLSNIVRGKLWNLAKSSDEKVVRSDTIEETEDSKEKEPVDKIEENDSFERAIELLENHPKIQGKPDHELLILAFSDGVELDDIGGLVEMTDLSRERIYQIKRELREIYPEIANQLRTGGSYR